MDQDTAPADSRQTLGMAAAKLSGLPVGSNQHAKGEGRQICLPMTKEHAAALFGVSVRSVTTALAVSPDDDGDWEKLPKGHPLRRSFQVMSDAINEMDSAFDDSELFVDGYLP